MSIQFSCPECGQKYNVEERLAGKRATCKKCGVKISIPAPQQKEGRTGPAKTSAAKGEGVSPARGRTKEKSQPPAKHALEIRNHLKRHLGEPDAVFKDFNGGELPLEVLLYAPKKERDWWTLVTLGMSDTPMDAPPEAHDHRHAELMLCMPADWDARGALTRNSDAFWPLEQILRTARLPHNHQFWLTAVDTIPNGDPAEPFHHSTEMCCWLLLPPIWLPDVAQEFPLQRALTTLRFLQLIPLYESEMNYKLQKGFAGLTSRLDGIGVPALMLPNRLNIYSDNRVLNILMWIRGRKWRILMAIIFILATPEILEKLNKDAKARKNAQQSNNAIVSESIDPSEAKARARRRSEGIMSKHTDPSHQSRGHSPPSTPSHPRRPKALGNEIWQHTFPPTPTKQPRATGNRRPSNSPAPTITLDPPASDLVAPQTGNDWTPKVGEHLEAKWGSRWYPVKILRIESDGKYFIHYTKYPDSRTTFDEAVAIERLRQKSEE